MDEADFRALELHREANDRYFGSAGFGGFEDERPVHQPDAPEAPIPGRHWYSGCDPDRPRVNLDGICEGCGGNGCPVCGRENCPDHAGNKAFA